MISIGIDPSINSTGICVMDCRAAFDTVTGKTTYDINTEYYIIGTKPTKATTKFVEENSDKFVFVDYGKDDIPKDAEYYKKELVKTENIMKSAESLNEILSSACPDIAVMEGVSYGSTSGASIVDLAGLNFVYRSVILEKVCDDMVIASPMEIKKFATGNGGVDKDTMLKVWKLCEKLELDQKAKLDDLADAYFMALYGVCKWFPDFEKSLELPKVEIPKRTRKKKVDELQQSAIDTFTDMEKTAETD